LTSILEIGTPRRSHRGKVVQNIHCAGVTTRSNGSALHFRDAGEGKWYLVGGMHALNIKD
jgi:hypothetical protein